MTAQPFMLALEFMLTNKTVIDVHSWWEEGRNGKTQGTLLTFDDRTKLYLFTDGEYYLTDFSVKGISEVATIRMVSGETECSGKIVITLSTKKHIYFTVDDAMTLGVRYEDITISKDISGLL